MGVAQRGVKETTDSSDYGLWQSSSTGVVPGINGRVDTDVSYINYPNAIVKGGFNNNKAPTPKPVTPPAPPKKTMEVTAKVDGKTYKGKLTEV